MESSSATSRFRFRDHQEMDNSTHSDSSSDISSVSSDHDHESELESMTGKGIKHLCSELIELKAASDEDFLRNIFSNYSAFIRIFDEVEGMEIELMQLKSQVSTQKKLVKELVDGIYLRVLSNETINSIIEESVCAEPIPSPPRNLEAHTNDLSESLDILLSENRIDEVIAILEIEDENFQRIQFEDNSSSDVLMLYNSAISERKAILTLQLTLLAENPRITAPELQKALVGLCRLGDSHLATQLLLKYYHSRLATGIHDMQCSKSFLQGVYIRQLAKFVFSMISQAARSFVMLYGETSPYASELIQWACKETEVFVAAFNKYIKSISEISGGLSTAVEAMQFAMSFCSLLETQRLVLQPCLIKHIRPCMEEVLQIHIEHFKKVVSIFTATDAWVLGRYLVSGILNVGCSSMVVGQQPEYCLLTNSGRKFVTLLQTITEDVTPLITLQMEGSILEGLVNLLMEYILILERAITCETNVTEKSGPKINLAESLPQQVSVLANLSTLENFFSNTVTSIFRGTTHINYVDSQPRELDSCILVIREATARLRAHFCQQFIHRMISSETGSRLTPETCVDSCGDPRKFHNVPSVAFQVLFLELRKLDKLAENNVFEEDWLTKLLRELLETIFVWISKSKVIWAADEESLMAQDPNVFSQFVLDMHFLTEITKYGGYFTNNPLALVTSMKSAFISAGLDSKRDVNDDGWAINAATEAIQRLLEIETTNLSPNDERVSPFEEELHENQSEYASDILQEDDGSSSEDSIVSEKVAVDIDPSEVAVDTERLILNTEFSPRGGSLDLLEEEDCSVDRSAINLTDASGEQEYVESENAACGELQFIEKTKVTNFPGQLLSVGIIEETITIRVPVEEGASSEPDDVAKFVISKLEDDAERELPEIEVAST